MRQIEMIPRFRGAKPGNRRYQFRAEWLDGTARKVPIELIMADAGDTDVSATKLVCACRKWARDVHDRAVTLSVTDDGYLQIYSPGEYVRRKQVNK